MGINKSEIKERIKDIDKISAKLHKERRELKKKMKEPEKKVGKTFVFKDNSYSVPEDDDDYWDTYIKVININEYGNYVILSYERDSHNDIEIKTTTLNSLSHYNEIPNHEFEEKFKKLVGELEKRMD